MKILATAVAVTMLAAAPAAAAAPAKTVPGGTSYWVAGDALAIKRSGNSIKVGNPSAACARGTRVSGDTWRMRTEDQQGNTTSETWLLRRSGSTLVVRYSTRGTYQYTKTTRAKAAKKGRAMGSGNVSDWFHGC